ncbi:LytR/AlgR family response regulator transcription factor [Flectobacillus major]|uniref:LytR/AlgR family response regulator transcription factor n=1 Tax=Flectobacillus major TaxID=103 RepID=UPI000413912B|nr:LytTR family transcriptional regulator DNA-binding domain-containing protein [Flectobacillus major]
MEKINILIIEDEMILAYDLQLTLEAEGYDIVGIAPNYDEAIRLYTHNHVDLILCDISLRDSLNGIETAKKLQSIKPAPLIYLTALADKITQYQAFETFPSAYITKPYDIVSLRIAIELALRNFAKPIHIEESEATKEKINLKRDTILLLGEAIFIKNNYAFIKIPIKEIVYLEADSTYCHLYTTSQKITMRLSLSSFLEQVKSQNLIRVHKTYAVNINWIYSFNEKEMNVKGIEIPIGKNFKEAFKNIF